MIARMLTVFVVVASVAIVVKSANLIIPMKNIDPDRIGGLWYGWARTGGLFDTASGCALAHLLHKEGDAYRTSFFYQLNGKVVSHTMDIIEDKTDKAKFVFANDIHTVALAVLDTDYDNYLIFYGLLGSKTEGVYYFGGRKPELVESLRGKLEAIVTQNEITLPFADVNQKNCPNIAKDVSLQ